MNLSGVMVVLLFLVIFGVVPILLIGLLGHRRPPTTIQASLQECPDCGALNPCGRQHCYCCGVSFPPPPSVAAEVTLIQRVKAAIDHKLGRRVEAQRPVKIVNG